MISGSIQEEDTIISIYALNIRATQYVRQILTSMKGEINSNTIIMGANIPLIPKDRSTKQKINKDRKTLNDTMDHLQGILNQNNGFHLFLKCTWNIL